MDIDFWLIQKMKHGDENAFNINHNLTILSKGVRLKMSNDIRLECTLCRMVI